MGRGKASGLLYGEGLPLPARARSEPVAPNAVAWWEIGTFPNGATFSAGRRRRGQPAEFEVIGPRGARKILGEIDDRNCLKLAKEIAAGGSFQARLKTGVAIAGSFTSDGKYVSLHVSARVGLAYEGTFPAAAGDRLRHAVMPTRLVS